MVRPHSYTLLRMPRREFNGSLLREHAAIWSGQMDFLGATADHRPIPAMWLSLSAAHNSNAVSNVLPLLPSNCKMVQPGPVSLRRYVCVVRGCGLGFDPVGAGLGRWIFYGQGDVRGGWGVVKRESDDDFKPCAAIRPWLGGDGLTDRRVFEAHSDAAGLGVGCGGEMRGVWAPSWHNA